MPNTVCLFVCLASRPSAVAVGRACGKENLFTILNVLYEWLSQDREILVTKGSQVRSCGRGGLMGDAPGSSPWTAQSCRLVSDRLNLSLSEFLSWRMMGEGIKIFMV